MSKPVIIIVGPTASGKSNLALNLAENLAGEIINADSVQIYKGLKILTAAPSDEDLMKVPHHLYSVIDPFICRTTVADWRCLAVKEIDEIFAKGKLPIVVGGTGMYIYSLMNGISNIPEIPIEIHKSIEEKFNEIGKDAFWNMLLLMDPNVSKHIRCTDSQRMRRAAEVKLHTGKSIFEWWSNPVETEGYNFLTILINKDREYLYNNCNKRFWEMIDKGAIEEVIEINRKCMQYPYTLQNVIGLKEISSYLDGKINISEAISNAQKRTRHYAKRQITWFKHHLTPDLAINSHNDEEVFNDAYSFISDKLNYQSISIAAL